MCECYRQLGIQTASRHALETNVTCNQAVCPVVFHWTWPVKDALLSSTGRYGSDTVAIASGLRLTPGSGAGFSSITLAQAFAERLLSLADWSAGRAIAQDHALAERVVAIWDELITLDVVATNMMNLADSAPQPHENRTARRRMRRWGFRDVHPDRDHSTEDRLSLRIKGQVGQERPSRLEAASDGLQLVESAARASASSRHSGANPVHSGRHPRPVRATHVASPREAKGGRLTRNSGISVRD